MKTIRVVMADDHPVVRSGICALLERAPDICVVGEASDGVEALHLVKELAPDVLLLDLEMPGLSGMEVAQQVQAAQPMVLVLALSAYDDEQYVAGLFACGAAGYLTKDQVPGTIIEAVRGVARGDRGWLSRRVAARLVARARPATVPPVSLTERERATLRLVIVGRTDQEVSQELGVAERTVRYYLRQICNKLGVNSRVEAAVQAVRLKLVDE